MGQKSDKTALVEPAIRQFLPPCQVKCPINEDIQRTNILISLLPTDPEQALPLIRRIGDYLYEHNPLFTICSYVCGLCELACNYAGHGGAIRRRLLKRFIADQYSCFLPEKPPWSIHKDKARVAVIGGGPAGLMAAYEMSRCGYRVTLFEASERLGGALWLIPHYRLPEDVLNSAIDNLVRVSGFDVISHCRVGELPVTLESLHDQGFEALFVARGTPAPRVITFGGKAVPGQQLSGVMFGNTLLYEVSHANLGPDYFMGKRVLVVGGGNVAFDSARTARRLGGSVRIICLESSDKTSRDGIHAEFDEVRGAWEEGVEILYSRGVSEIREADGRFTGICSPHCLQVYDDDGFNPAFALNDLLEIEGDILVIAVGQGPDRSVLLTEELLDASGKVDIDPFTLQSMKKPWVFIGGDLRHIGYMAEAMHDGVVAAESMQRYLEGRDLREGRLRELVPMEAPFCGHYRHEPEVVWIPPEKRLHFQIFEKGFTLAEAVGEARRCLACGPCVSCKACIDAGIQGSIPAVEVNLERCSGCGVCVSSCPYGAAMLKILGGRLISGIENIECKGCGTCVAVCPAGARVTKSDLLPEFVRNLTEALTKDRP